MTNTQVLRRDPDDPDGERMAPVDTYPQLAEWRVTFGQRWRREHHPAFVAGTIDFEVDPDGWVAVLAPDETAARNLAFEKVGWVRASIRPADGTDWSLWPIGELACWTTTEPTRVGS